MVSRDAKHRVSNHATSERLMTTSFETRLTALLRMRDRKRVAAPEDEGYQFNLMVSRDAKHRVSNHATSERF